MRSQKCQNERFVPYRPLCQRDHLQLLAEHFYPKIKSRILQPNSTNLNPEPSNFSARMGGLQFSVYAMCIWSAFATETRFPRRSLIGYRGYHLEQEMFTENEVLLDTHVQIQLTCFFPRENAGIRKNL